MDMMSDYGKIKRGQKYKFKWYKILVISATGSSRNKVPTKLTDRFYISYYLPFTNTCNTRTDTKRNRFEMLTETW